MPFAGMLICFIHLNDEEVGGERRKYVMMKTSEAKNSSFLLFCSSHHQFSVEQLYFLEQRNRFDFKCEIVSIQMSTICWR